MVSCETYSDQTDVGISRTESGGVHAFIRVCDDRPQAAFRAVEIRTGTALNPGALLSLARLDLPDTGVRSILFEPRMEEGSDGTGLVIEDPLTSDEIEELNGPAFVTFVATNGVTLHVAVPRADEVTDVVQLSGGGTSTATEMEKCPG